ncbi:MAG: hypothetical protein KKD11_04215, partial [Candidatus Omnitrophica bacterium]|nr:hypothetical protein [Candidatus Omnitrophota bacterium]
QKALEVLARYTRALAFGAIFVNLFFVEPSNILIFMTRTIIQAVALIESAGSIIFKKSLLGLTVRYQFRPPATTGGARAIISYVLLYGGFIATSMGLGLGVTGWFESAFMAGEIFKLIAGGLIFVNSLYLLNYGLWVFMTGAASHAVSFPAQFSLVVCTIGIMMLGLPLYILALPTGIFIIAKIMSLIKLKKGKPEVADLDAKKTAITFAGGDWLGSSIFKGINQERKWDEKSGKYKPSDYEKLVKRWIEIKKKDDENLKIETYIKGYDKNGKERIFVKTLQAIEDRELQIIRETDEFVKRWRWMRTNDSKSVELIRRNLGLENLILDKEIEKIRVWFDKLHAAEIESDITLFNLRQLDDPVILRELELEYLRLRFNSQDKQDIVNGWRIRRHLFEMMNGGGQSQDTGINLTEMAEALKENDLSEKVVFYIISNKYNGGPTPDEVREKIDTADMVEFRQREKLACLIEYILNGKILDHSRDVDITKGTAYVLYDWTPFASKSSMMTGMDMVGEELLNIKSMLIMDRDASCGNMDLLIEDIERARQDPNMVIIVPGRATTNVRMPIGQASQLIEEGHRSYEKGVMDVLGGTGGETVGTGWGNIVSVLYGKSMEALQSIRQPTVPLTSRLKRLQLAKKGRWNTLMASLFGLIGFIPNAVGISEDIWAVEQAAHTAIALGLKPKMHRSKAFWHKVRESYSHTSWFSAYPRWSGGFLQKCRDLLMIKIHELGPSSIFAKEVKRSGGRFFISAPFALINIAIMPLAIFFGLTPFVGINLIFWLIGFVFNQVLTIHGLNAYIEAAGYNYATGFLGGVAAFIFTGSIPLAILAFVAGGFIIGLGRWISVRFRDMILFA